MTVDIEELEKLLLQPEGERLEFKTAERDFSYDSLAKYVVHWPTRVAAKLFLALRTSVRAKLREHKLFQTPVKLLQVYASTCITGFQHMR